MEIYLLKSAAILAILFIFYKSVLENTSAHNFKRAYLLGSLLVSFLIPFITFTSYVESSPIIPNYSEGVSQMSYTEIEQTINYWPFILGTIYGLGVLFFSMKFIRNLFGLIRKIKRNPKFRNRSFINVLLTETVIPHTFFSYIFLNKMQFELGEIPKEVMLHEETHSRQKHSYDVLLVEILQIIFWFNPLFYFLKESIKLNHEFLADRAVLNTGAEPSEYQNILLTYTSILVTSSLANSLNYSSIKKRFTIMKTHTSKRAIWFRSLLILPLLSILIYGFSTKEALSELKIGKSELSDVTNVLEIMIDAAENIYIENEKIPLNEFDKKITSQHYDITTISTSSKVSIEFAQQLIIKLIERNLTNGLSFCVNADGGPISENYATKVLEPLTQRMNRKASDAEIIEYNKLAKKYNAVDIENRIIKKDDLERLEIIYRKMTDEQKAKAQPFPECIPPPPPVSKVPSVTNGNLYSPAQAPPPPNSNMVEYLKELANKGAVFYIGPHKYSAEEALKMVQKSTNEVTIDVSDYPDVKLGGC